MIICLTQNITYLTRKNLHTPCLKFYVVLKLVRNIFDCRLFNRDNNDFKELAQILLKILDRDNNYRP